MKLATIITIGISCLLYMSSCTKKSIKGEGSTVTETRDLSKFESVEADGSSDVTILPSTRDYVEVIGYQNLVPVYESKITNGRLTLKFMDKYINVRNSNIKVNVYTTSMNSFKLNGSGNITVRPDITSSSMSAEINGSGNIYIESNEFENMNYTVNGSGEIRARNASADNVKADISGSGNIEVTANKTLDVRISGSGNVDYWGNAVITNINISGSGKVQKH